MHCLPAQRRYYLLVRRQVGDQGLPAVAQLVATTPEVAGLIDEVAQVRLSEFLSSEP